MGSAASLPRQKRKTSTKTNNNSKNTSETSSVSSTSVKSTTTITVNGRQFHNTDSIYCLPNDEEELDRLVGQHFALKTLFDGANINPHVFDYITLGDGAKICDIGCGPGNINFTKINIKNNRI
ncbi:hypothetical protein BJ944DRAFT_273778 [Cunninghamella echinulata]|nr:hypothetical protein BJ944DRAFT_273778 [Cunninghamella echinulata]